MSYIVCRMSEYRVEWVSGDGRGVRRRRSLSSNKTLNTPLPAPSNHQSETNNRIIPLTLVPLPAGEGTYSFGPPSCRWAEKISVFICVYPVSKWKRSSMFYQLPSPSYRLPLLSSLTSSSSSDTSSRGGRGSCGCPPPGRIRPSVFRREPRASPPPSAFRRRNR